MLESNLANIRHLYLGVMWLGVDARTNNKKILTYMFNRDWTKVLKYVIPILYPIVNMIG